MYVMLKKQLRCLAALIVLASLLRAQDCGKEGSTNKRISGGTFTYPHQFPWMVHFTFWIEHKYLWVRNKMSHMYGCGGAIISRWHILTAKHCTEEPGKSFKFGYMKVGAYDINDDESFHHVKIKKALYPREDKRNHDLAIIRLEKPLDLSDPTIGKVCLPKSEKEVYVGKLVTSMGWGMENKKRPDPTKSNELKEVTLEVANKISKQYIFTKVNYIKEVPQDPCVGDSGGPLIMKENKRWTIIGTVNGQGYDCRTGLTSPFYNGFGLFNKISPHLKWIKSVIEDDTGDEAEASDYGNYERGGEKAGERCKGRKYGDHECCKPDRPCNEGEGDCDTDDECKEGLVCRKDNCNKFQTWYHPNDDCCERKT